MKNEMSQVQFTLENYVISNLHKTIAFQVQNGLSAKLKVDIWFKLNDEVWDRLTNVVKTNLK